MCDLAVDIDDVIVWEDLQTCSKKQLSDFLQAQHFDAVIHSQSKSIITKAAKLAKIKVRVDQTRKLDKLMFSNRVVKSWHNFPGPHQAQRNLSLLAGLKLPVYYTCDEITSMIRLKEVPAGEKVLTYLDASRFNLVLHPFSNKNGREWPLTHFETLVEKLDKKKFNIIISGSAKEGELLQGSVLSDQNQVSNICGKTTVAELFNLLAHVDGVVVSGTGPLHIAAALGTRCLGLFPTAKGEYARPDFNRWQALGSQATSIASSQVCADKCEVENCACMQALSVNYVQSFITQWYQDYCLEKK